MGLPRDVIGTARASALRWPGYERVRPRGPHVRVTTRKGGAHPEVIPLTGDPAKSIPPPAACRLGPWHHAPDGQDALVKAGIPEDAALEITRRLERRGSPSAMSIPIGATLAGFGLLVAGIGWVKSDVGQVRAEIHVSRGLIEANRDHIDAVNERVSENTEHLIRIETLLEERLPERN